jgi:hypothetical protein
MERARRHKMLQCYNASASNYYHQMTMERSHDLFMLTLVNSPNLQRKAGRSGTFDTTI